MPNKDYVEIAAIIDRSGSMFSQISDTIGGYNSFIADQKSQPGKTFVSLCLFDHVVSQVYRSVNIENLPLLDESTYKIGGSTALFDAVGTTTIALRDRIDAMPEEMRPHKVIVLIITDGQENASKEFFKPQVKKLIDTLEDEFGWDFVFMGVDPRSIEEATSIGIKSFKASFYDGQQTPKAYQAMSAAVNMTRSGTKLNASNEMNWKGLTGDARNLNAQAQDPGDEHSD